MGGLANLSDAANFVDGITGWEEKLKNKADAWMKKWEAKHPGAEVDPETVGQNFGRSYPSYFLKNPQYKDINGNILDYMGEVDNWNWKEYAGYLHDAEYIDMGITSGAKYILASYKTYMADIRLMARTLYLSVKHLNPGGIVAGSVIGANNILKIPYGWIIR